MVDIQPQTVLDESYADGKPWLREVDRKFNQSVTLDLTAFTDAGLLDAATGTYPAMVKSGVAIREGATAGLYVPAVDAETAEGHVFTATPKATGSTRAAAAMMTHGVVNESSVPGGLPTGGRPALIRYV